MPNEEIVTVTEGWVSIPRYNYIVSDVVTSGFGTVTYSAGEPPIIENNLVWVSSGTTFGNNWNFWNDTPKHDINDLNEMYMEDVEPGLP